MRLGQVDSRYWVRCSTSGGVYSSWHRTVYRAVKRINLIRRKYPETEISLVFEAVNEGVRERVEIAIDPALYAVSAKLVEHWLERKRPPLV